MICPCFLNSTSAGDEGLPVARFKKIVSDPTQNESVRSPVHSGICSYMCRGYI